MTRISPIHGINELEIGLSTVSDFSHRYRRPFITLTYAQSIDGSIAARDRTPLKLSGESSMALTHRLRALFQAILIGIGTVKADDPQLTTRLNDGTNPQPIVLDTHLRISPGANLLQRSDCSSWIVGSSKNNDERRQHIVNQGGTVLPCALSTNGMIDLHALGEILYNRGIKSLMVEGGAKVITSFLTAGIVDLLIITIAPKLIGGLQVIDSLQEQRKNIGFQLGDVHYEQLGEDIIIWAKPEKIMQ